MDLEPYWRGFVFGMSVMAFSMGTVVFWAVSRKR